jgi:hypothetical protein
MNLPREAVEEFQKIYMEVVGQEISFSEAEIEAEKMLALRLLISTKNKNEQS